MTERAVLNCLESYPTTDHDASQAGSQNPAVTAAAEERTDASRQAANGGGDQQTPEREDQNWVDVCEHIKRANRPPTQADAMFSHMLMSNKNQPATERPAKRRRVRA